MMNDGRLVLNDRRLLLGADETGAIVLYQQDGDDRPPDDPDLGKSERRDDADLGGPQNAAPREHDLSGSHVFARLPDVFMVRILLQNGDLVDLRVLASFGAELLLVGIFEGDHGVGAVRNRSTGHDADRRTRFDAPVAHVTGGHVAHDGEAGRGLLRGARHIGGAHRESVHGGVGLGGNVETGRDFLSQYLAQGLPYWFRFRLQNVEGGEDFGVCLFERDHLNGLL